MRETLGNVQGMPVSSGKHRSHPFPEVRRADPDVDGDVQDLSLAPHDRAWPVADAVDSASRAARREGNGSGCPARTFRERRRSARASAR